MGWLAEHPIGHVPSRVHHAVDATGSDFQDLEAALGQEALHVLDSGENQVIGQIEQVGVLIWTGEVATVSGLDQNFAAWREPRPNLSQEAPEIGNMREHVDERDHIIARMHVGQRAGANLQATCLRMPRLPDHRLYALDTAIRRDDTLHGLHQLAEARANVEPSNGLPIEAAIEYGSDRTAVAPYPRGLATEYNLERTCLGSVLAADVRLGDLVWVWPRIYVNQTATSALDSSKTGLFGPLPILAATAKGAVDVHHRSSLLP